MTRKQQEHLLKSFLIKGGYFVPTKQDIKDIRKYMINKIFNG